MAEGQKDISGMLIAWGKGDEAAFNELISHVYPELRRIARQRIRRGVPEDGLQSGELANEAYLKLLRSRGIRCENRVHFFALCAQIIRRVLVDHARNRRYAKRGGEFVHIPLNEELLGTRAGRIDVLVLDEALASLAKFDNRKARVVELRFFGGLSVEETAETLQISAETVMRDWKMAKSWLFRELSHAGGLGKE
jgi:RNA polymerase sigma factor (TIGR02999 family)